MSQRGSKTENNRPYLKKEVYNLKCPCRDGLLQYNSLLSLCGTNGDLGSERTANDWFSEHKRDVNILVR